MRLSKLKLKLNQDKCFFFQQSCEYLGHLVSRDGVAPSPGKVEALLSVEPPSDLSSLRAFLGLVGYYRRFVPNFAALAAPLFGLLKKDVAFVMGPQQIAACEALKAAVAQGNVLAIPDVSKPFKLYTDASDLLSVVIQLRRKSFWPLSLRSSGCATTCTATDSWSSLTTRRSSGFGLR
eukprot:m.37788 g.37788  ORF g.37788 m.37788 type:complete len:178 (-) comp45130_c0_seq3:696-1229(-)